MLSACCLRLLQRDLLPHLDDAVGGDVIATLFLDGVAFEIGEDRLGDV